MKACLYTYNGVNYAIFAGGRNGDTLMADIDIFYITDDGVLKKVVDVPKLQYPRVDFLMYVSVEGLYILAGTTPYGLATKD